MKRTILFALVFALCLAPVGALGASAGWYFKASGDGTQPLVNGGKLYSEYGTLCLGSKDEKVIYLTFDAGYENGNVKKTLDILRRHDVPAAFFVLPALIRQHGELINRMVTENHTVCNHSYSHKNLSQSSKAELKEEIEKLEAVFTECTGKQMSRYFRPPEGTYSEQMLSSLQELGYVPVFWSFAYADWDNNAQKSTDWAKEKILSNVHNGMVMLLHPTSATNAAILDEVITELKARGYRFGTLDELSGAAEAGKYDELEEYKARGVVLAENRSEEKKLALTFDDGPDPVYTGKILDILKKYGVKATFFMIGRSIERYPDIARRVVAEGHEAANHTYSHCRMSGVTREALISEITKTQELLERLGSTSHLFRPPGGDYLSRNIETVSSLGYRYVLWSWRQDTKDWSRTDSAGVVSTVMTNLCGGDIILFHDGNSGKSPTPDALEELLPRLIGLGYEFVTVSELFPA